MRHAQLQSFIGSIDSAQLCIRADEQVVKVFPFECSSHFAYCVCIVIDSSQGCKHKCSDDRLPCQSGESCCMLLIPTTPDLRVPLCTLKRQKATEHPSISGLSPTYQSRYHTGAQSAAAEPQSTFRYFSPCIASRTVHHLANRGTAAVKDVSEKRYKMGYLGHGHEI